MFPILAHIDDNVNGLYESVEGRHLVTVILQQRNYTAEAGVGTLQKASSRFHAKSRHWIRSILFDHFLQNDAYQLRVPKVVKNLKPNA